MIYNPFKIDKDKNLIDYHFKLLTKDMENNSTYYNFGLNLFMGVQDRMFKLIFDGAMKEMRKKGKQTPDQIIQNKFSVPDRFLKTLQTSVNKTVGQISKEVKKDAIIIYDWNVKGGLFEKTDNVWIITITISGKCRDVQTPEGG